MATDQYRALADKLHNLVNAHGIVTVLEALDAVSERKAKAATAYGNKAHATSWRRIARKMERAAEAARFERLS